MRPTDATLLNLLRRAEINVSILAARSKGEEREAFGREREEYRRAGDAVERGMEPFEKKLERATVAWEAARMDTEYFSLPKTLAPALRAAGVTG